VNEFGDAFSYLGRILGVFIGNRVDLCVSSTRVKVCLQEGLDIGIGALKPRVKTRRPRINSVRGPT